MDARVLVGNAVFLNDHATIHCRESHSDSWADYEGVVIDKDSSEGFPIAVLAAAIAVIAVLAILAVRIRHRSQTGRRLLETRGRPLITNSGSKSESAP